MRSPLALAAMTLTLVLAGCGGSPATPVAALTKQGTAAPTRTATATQAAAATTVAAVPATRPASPTVQAASSSGAVAVAARPITVPPRSSASVTEAPRAPVRAAAPVNGESQTREIKAFVDPLMRRAMPAAHAPGAMVSIVSGGELVFAGGYGVADRATGAAVDTRTLFRVASISKLFTTTAVLQLLEQGRVRLDEDINRYLDLFQVPPTYSRPITLAALLTHTAGFNSDQDPDEYFASAANLQPLGPFLKQHLPDRIAAPGTQYAYSNYGLALAGYIVQRMSGVPFDDYMDAHVLGPLGMTRSTFRQPPPGDLVSSVAMGYQYHGGSYVPQPGVYFSDAPDAALVTTAPDIARFMIAQLHGGAIRGSRILSEASVRTMQTQHFDAQDDDGTRIGYAFFLGSRDGHDTVEHSGKVEGFLSLLVLVPDADFGVCISWSSGDDDPESVVDAILKRFLP